MESISYTGPDTLLKALSSHSGSKGPTFSSIPSLRGVLSDVTSLLRFDKTKKALDDEAYRRTITGFLSSLGDLLPNAISFLRFGKTKQVLDEESYRGTIVDFLTTLGDTMTEAQTDVTVKGYTLKVGDTLTKKELVNFIRTNTASDGSKGTQSALGMPSYKNADDRLSTSLNLRGRAQVMMDKPGLEPAGCLTNPSDADTAAAVARTLQREMGFTWDPEKSDPIIKANFKRDGGLGGPSGALLIVNVDRPSNSDLDKNREISQTAKRSGLQPVHDIPWEELPQYVRSCREAGMPIDGTISGLARGMEFDGYLYDRLKARSGDDPNAPVPEVTCYLDGKIVDRDTYFERITAPAMGHSATTESGGVSLVETIPKLVHHIKGTELLTEEELESLGYWLPQMESILRAKAIDVTLEDCHFETGSTDPNDALLRIANFIRTNGAEGGASAVFVVPFDEFSREDGEPLSAGLLQLRVFAGVTAQLEFAAGKTEVANNSIEVECARELKEETGWIYDPSVPPILTDGLNARDMGFSNALATTLIVPARPPIEKVADTQLSDNEIDQGLKTIHGFPVRLLPEYIDYCESKGLGVDGTVSAVGAGMEVARWLRKEAGKT